MFLSKTVPQSVDAGSSYTAPGAPILRNQRKCDAIADLNVSFAW